MSQRATRKGWQTALEALNCAPPRERPRPPRLITTLKMQAPLARVAVPEVVRTPQRVARRNPYRQRLADPFTMIRPRSLLRSRTWPWPEYDVEKCCYQLLPPRSASSGVLRFFALMFVSCCIGLVVGTIAVGKWPVVIERVRGTAVVLRQLSNGVDAMRHDR